MRVTKEGQQKGITLIALVITIIVMLILVAVTISMAVNGGLFEHAGKAVGDTNNAMIAEGQLGNGGVEVDGEWYNSIDEYLATVGKDKVLTPTQITITGDSAVEVKGTITLLAEVDQGELKAEDIEWTSSNPEAATVSEGVVTGVNSTKGTTTITATYVPNNTVVATKEITVNAKLVGPCETCGETGTITVELCPMCGKECTGKDVCRATPYLQCNVCQKELIGDFNNCPICGSDDVEHIESSYYVYYPCFCEDRECDSSIISIDADCSECIDGVIYDVGE